MAAPLGNKFWQMAANPGRPRVFSTPEEMYQLACEYFQWCEDNPIIQKDWVGKDGDEVFREKPIPYTQDGFCLYLGIDDDTFRLYGKDEKRKEFWGVYTYVMKTIKTQKFNGAAVGIFNASIIARDLGLVDKTQSEVDGKQEIVVTYKRKLTSDDKRDNAQ